MKMKNKRVGKAVFQPIKIFRENIASYKDKTTPTYGMVLKEIVSSDCSNSGCKLMFNSLNQINPL